MASTSEPIYFIDIGAAEQEERRRLQDRLAAIVQAAGGNLANLGTLPQEQQDEYARIYHLLRGKPKRVVDPLFRAVQADFHANGQDVPDHDGHGRFPQQAAGGLSGNEKALAAVYGILERDSHTDPDAGQPFASALALARGEYNGNRALYDQVLDVLVEEGHQDGPGSVLGVIVQRSYSEVRADQWGMVVQTLVQQGVLDTDPLLRLKTQLALASAAGANDTAPPSAISIDLPDLEKQTDVEIVATNLQAMQAIYFAAMLEEVKIFQVTEKLLEFFQLGMLPLSRGRAGDLLYNYWRQSVTRMTEVERRNLYARCFGLPGGDASQGQPNREFNDLWLRFISAVSSYVRQLSVDDMLRASTPIPVNTEQVRKAGRDLAANLSLHGYGVAYFAAIELQKQLHDVVALLSDDEVKGSYGARDMWQVIDQIATLELGGARNSIRYRTMATSGAIVIRWLADHADLLAQSGRAAILDLGQVRTPLPRPRGTKATTNPMDSDLVDACDQWLAVTGTQENRVEEMAQPTEAPSSTSRPIQIPAVARDMLESVGIKSNGLFGS